jgi:hypothetical protein
VGDYWYDFCQMAMGDSSWEFVFVAWFEIEDYMLAFKTEIERSDFEAHLDSEERLLYGQGVSLEQLNWRRLTIKDTYKGVIDDFRQQYPATADEAFLTSGRPVFPMIQVKTGIKNAKEPIKRGYLNWMTRSEVGGASRVGKQLEFKEDERGYWDIWEDVKSNTENLYVLGADVAEGIAVVPELGNRGGDYSVAKILRRDNKKMVARLRERIDPDLFADELHKASIYWNCSLLIESNPGGSGNVVIHDLKAIPGVRLLKKYDLTGVVDESRDSYGWLTTKDSKHELIDELTERIREGTFIDLSKNFWLECSTYVRDEKGRTNAQSRKYDDEVIASAIAFQGDKLLPALYNYTPRAKELFPRDYDVPQNRKTVITQRQVMEETLVAL